MQVRQSRDMDSQNAQSMGPHLRCVLGISSFMCILSCALFNFFVGDQVLTWPEKSLKPCLASTRLPW
jgi:hypothetical protein